MKRISTVKSLTSKVLAILLVVMTLASILAIPVSAASSWPSLSSSSYCEFTATKTIYVYRNSSCTVRGTCTPAKSYNAYIATNDVCRILQITSSYIKLQYPTSSGYKTGFIKRSALFGVSSPTEQITSKGKVDTYVNAGGKYYGYVAKGDKVYVCGTSGNYTLVIYQAKSGNRAYKLGYVRTNLYNDTIKKGVINTYKTKTFDCSSFENWVKSAKANETNIGGVIVDIKVLSWKTTYVTYQTTGVNGPYKIVQLRMPYKVQYTLHSHTYNTGYGSHWYFGQGGIVINNTCNCGYHEQVMVWELPDLPGAINANSPAKPLYSIQPAM